MSIKIPVLNKNSSVKNKNGQYTHIKLIAYFPKSIY
jgi:hypothetical protein